MPTSLRGIAEKAARDVEHRFGNLFGLLNPSFLLESWRSLNKRAAPGVDRVDAREYGQDLETFVKDYPRAREVYEDVRESESQREYSRGVYDKSE